MKLTFTNGKITASPENEDDIKLLLGTNGGGNGKRYYKKPCELCGKKIATSQKSNHIKQIHANDVIPQGLL